MHIVRVCERLPRLKLKFRISRSFRPRNQANLGSKIGFWIHRKEHNQKKIFLIPRCGSRIGQIPSLAGCRGILRFQSPGRDTFNQNSDRSDREKRTTSKGGPVFSKLFRLDRTDPLSFGPKFPEFLVEWIAPQDSGFHQQNFLDSGFQNQRFPVPEYMQLTWANCFSEVSSSAPQPGL